MITARYYGALAALLSIALLTSACGIKPSSLEPPEGADKNSFPKTYPAE